MTMNGQCEAYIQRGLAAHNEGNVALAIAEYKRALDLSPHRPDALHLMGVASLQLGEAECALDYLRRAVDLQRNNPAFIGNLAHAYFATKQYVEAAAAFRKASRLNPREMQYQLGIANSLAMQGKLSEAETLLKRLTALFPQSALAYFNLANVLRDQGRADESIECYRSAIKLDPQLVDARNNLAGALHRMLDFEQAEQEFRTCIEIAPDYLLGYCNLASVLIDIGRFDDAAAICREVIARAPDFEPAHRYLGAALAHQGRLLEALESHRRSLRLAPDDPKVLQNLGSILTDCGYFRQGAQALTRAIALNPNMASSHLLLGQALLGHGCFAEGWAGYAYRPWPRTFSETYPGTALTRTLPPQLAGKRLCIVKEQGLGDEIFFLRFLPELHGAGALITYVGSPKLASLLSRSPYIQRVVDDSAGLPEADATMLVADLPYILSLYQTSPLHNNKDAKTVGAHSEHFAEKISVFWPEVPLPITLTPLAERKDEMRRRLATFGAPPYIGLTWRGGTPPREQRLVIWALFKEIGIRPLGAALKPIDGTFIALQRSPQPGEIQTLSKELGRQVQDLSALNEDLEGMLALLSVIDEYVAVSNTNVHLRASANRPSRVLVPCPPDWRWMHTGRSSPWFPGSVVYRQLPTGDFSLALSKLQHDLLTMQRAAD